MMIAGMLRVKNEARWIEPVIRSLQPICSRIDVLDDGSEDVTPVICAKLGARVHHSPFQDLNETRDKNFLLSKVAQAKPDWVISIDGDEELAPGSEAIISELIAGQFRPDCYRFHVLYLWDSPDQIRVDRWYRNFRRPSLFRFRPGAQFRSTMNGGNFHCGNVPDPRIITDCDVKLLHYGYMDREDRIRKYEWYNAQDPNNRAEDGYRHMVIGDVFPADSRFRYAGPLELEPLEATVPQFLKAA